MPTMDMIIIVVLYKTECNGTAKEKVILDVEGFLLISFLDDRCFRFQFVVIIARIGFVLTRAF